MLIAVNAALYIWADFGPDDESTKFSHVTDFGPEASLKDIEVNFEAQVLGSQRKNLVFVEVDNGDQIHETLPILDCSRLLFIWPLLSFISCIICIFDFLVDSLNGLVKINELLTEFLEDSFKISLALVVLVNHEHSTLLVVPFYVRFQSNLLSTIVSWEEWEICWSI